MIQCPLETFARYCGANSILHQLPSMIDIVATAKSKDKKARVNLRHAIEKASPTIRRLAFSIHRHGQLVPIDVQGKTIYDGISRWLALVVLALQDRPKEILVKWHLPDDSLSTGGSQN